MSNITLEVYSNKYFDKWDDFIEKSRNGTIFHTRKFLSYHPEGRFKDCSLVLLHKGNIVSVLPACLTEENGRLILASHQGSTYGGFVIPFKFGIEKSLAVVDLVLEFSESEGIEGIWMRYPENVFEIEPSQEIKFAMWHRGLRIDYIELSTSYNLTLYDSKVPITWEAKKSYERGVTCKFDDLNFQEFYNILYETLTSKYNSKPTHTLEEIYKLKELNKDKFVLVSTYYKNTLVGGMIVFLANSKAAHIFYSSIKKECDKGIYLTDTLVDFTIRTLKELGIKFVNYGISTEDRGRKINLNLFKFKERFKGFGVNREVWRWYT